jgi:hypothetical protein
MIALSAAVVIGAAIALALFSLHIMGRESNNLANVATEPRQGISLGVVLLSIFVGLLLLGVTGVGPLANVLVLAP